MMRARSAFSVLGFVVAASMLTESSALAFCRTTTADDIPPNWDATIEGCPKGKDKQGRDAIPLWWRNACVGYSIHDKGSDKIAANDAAAALSRAFTRWTGATCPTSGNGRSRASIDVRYLGEVECGKVEQNRYGGPNQNVMLFRDENWEHGKEVLGLARTSFNAETGELYGVDIEFNTQDMDPLVVDENEPVPRPGYDFLSIATHEAGHFFGLAHSDVKGSTMYARYVAERGQTSLRNLSPDDVLGICSIYNPDGNRTVVVREREQQLEAKEYQGRQCNPTPRNGYTSKCMEPPGCLGSMSPARPAGPALWGSAFGLMLLVGRRLRHRVRRRRADPEIARRLGNGRTRTRR